MRSPSDAVSGLLPLTPAAFEILLAVAEAPLHGYAIMLAIEERTDGRVSLNPGTLYRALDRLVEQGLLERVEGPPGDRGAGRHKFFRLTRLGGKVAAAEGERLADQVSAARARRLMKPERSR